MKKFIYSLPFILGALCFIFETLSPSYVAANGFLVEPFFFLIPVGYIFILLGIIVLIIKKGFNLLNKSKRV